MRKKKKKERKLTEFAGDIFIYLVSTQNSTKMIFYYLFLTEEH